jgi:hypothetical protein
MHGQASENQAALSLPACLNFEPGTVIHGACGSADWKPSIEADEY